MKKTLLLLAGLSLFASQANAAPTTVVLNFDDIPGGSIQNSFRQISTYKGFNFSSGSYWFDVEDSVYWNYGAKSGDFAMLNIFDGTRIITEENGADFTFDGLWAKKWDTPKESGGADSLFGVLQGYNNGALVWNVDTSLNGSYEYYGSQTSLIDELRLDFNRDSISGQSLVDNMTLTTVSPVPEPSSIALMLGGLGLVGFMAARRTKKV